MTLHDSDPNADPDPEPNSEPDPRPKPVFTICVPSCNRGFKTLKLVRETLPRMDPDWELLVMDNASHEQTEGYAAIAELARTDARLTYLRHPINLGFHGNYVASFDYPRADHVMVISDEDIPNTDMIRSVLPLLKSKPELGVLRGGVGPQPGREPVNSFDMPETYFAAGNEAMLHYALFNNYFSGTIYHCALARRHGLVERLRQGVDANRIYPHLYFELLISARCDAATTPLISCFEGEEQPLTGPEDGHVAKYNPPYSFGSRVDQFIILRDAIREAVGLVREAYDYQLFVMMYLRLCEKYFHLISHVNMPLYHNNRIHTGLLQKSMLYVCGAGISGYPELAPASEEIFSRIAQIYNRFNLVKEE